jgi:FMN reductase
MSRRSVAVVVGNPRPRSRTWESALRIAQALGGPDAKINAFDLIDFGPKLLGWDDPDVGNAVQQVAAADIAVVASPTYKATYTGLLKLFLDQFAGGTGLVDVVAVPLQLGAASAHQLSPELHLKPVLVELGATIPAPALYALDAEPEQAEQAWLGRWASAVLAATHPA